MAQGCACIRIGLGRRFWHFYLPYFSLSHTHSFVSRFLFDRRGKVQEIENYLLPIITKRLERGMDSEDFDLESVSQYILGTSFCHEFTANVERYDHLAVVHCEQG